MQLFENKKIEDFESFIQPIVKYFFECNEGDQKWKDYKIFYRDEEGLYGIESIDGQTGNTLFSIGTYDEIKSVIDDISSNGWEVAEDGNKSIDFSEVKSERYSPSSTNCYIFEADRDILEQMLERIPKKEIKVVIDDISSIREYIEKRNADIELKILLNEKRDFEKACIELMDCGLSFDCEMSIFEQEGCLKSIEKSENELTKKLYQHTEKVHSAF